MTKILTLLLLIFPLCLMAQVGTQDRHPPSMEDRDEARESRFVLGFSLSPEVAFRTLKNTAGTPAGDAEISFRDEIERAKAGYSAGLSVLFLVSDMFHLESGAFYSDKGYRTTRLTATGAEPGNVEALSYIFTYDYLDIPLMMNVYLYRRDRNNVFVSGGFTGHLMVQPNLTTTRHYFDGTQVIVREPMDANFYRRIGVSPTIGVGYERNMGRALRLRIEPNAKYNLVSNQKGDVSEHLYSAGVRAAFYFLN